MKEKAFDSMKKKEGETGNKTWMNNNEDTNNKNKDEKFTRKMLE